MCERGNHSPIEINILEKALDHVNEICDGDTWNDTEKCAILTCTNPFIEYENTILLYNFPLDQQLRSIWFDRCGVLANADASNLKVCSNHFMPNDYEEGFNGEYKSILKFNAIPSRNLPEPNTPHNMPQEEIVINNRIKELEKEKSQLVYDIKKYNNRIKLKKKDIIMLKNQFGKIQSNSLSSASSINLLSKVFSDAQIKIVMGKKKVVWSDDDLAMAFSLRQMSSKEFYLYLKRFLNYPLPALSCVQRWAAST